MARWKLYLAALLLSLLSAGSYYIYHQHEHLAEARGAMWHAQVIAQADSARADSAVRAAARAKIHADSAEARAGRAVVRAQAAERLLAATQARAATVAASAPDTCAPYIAAVEQARDAVMDAGSAWHDAYDAQRIAVGHLRARGDSLASANATLTRTVGDLHRTSDDLAHASKPSFFSHLVPKVGIGATAGIDPFTHRPSTAVGVTLSWSVL